eukprot:SAG11_NODE_29512_length_310_cov_0.715640_1_plen_71_part_10
MSGSLSAAVRAGDHAPQPDLPRPPHALNWRTPARSARGRNFPNFPNLPFSVRKVGVPARPVGMNLYMHIRA